MSITVILQRWNTESIPLDRRSTRLQAALQEGRSGFRQGTAGHGRAWHVLLVLMSK